MNSIATRTDFTPEDLLDLPDSVDLELVDGQLVERPTSAVSSYVGGTLFERLRAHCAVQDLGWVFPADDGYKFFPDDPAKVRKPNVSFVRRDRLPEGLPDEGFLHVAADLVAEVLSPNELAHHIDRKVQEYLAAGVRLVWVINPETRTARVHRADGSITGLTERDELSGEDVIPGFRCRIADLFTGLVPQPMQGDAPASRSER